MIGITGDAHIVPAVIKHCPLAKEFVLGSFVVNDWMENVLGPHECGRCFASTPVLYLTAKSMEHRGDREPINQSINQSINQYHIHVGWFENISTTTTKVGGSGKPSYLAGAKRRDLEHQSNWLPNRNFDLFWNIFHNFERRGLFDGRNFLKLHTLLLSVVFRDSNCLSSQRSICSCNDNNSNNRTVTCKNLSPSKSKIYVGPESEFGQSSLMGKKIASKQTNKQTNKQTKQSIKQS
jgi:hypothetical protein